MLWRVKWRVTGVVAKFIHTVLCDEGRKDPSPAELLGMTTVMWVLATGALAAVSGMSGRLLAMPALIVGAIMAFMAGITTIGSAWFLVEWYRHLPELVVGADA